MPLSPLPIRGLPNDDTFVFVSLEKDGITKINQQNYGTVEDTAPLLEKLSEIFADRERDGVFEEDSNKIAKAVMVKATRSDKYGNVVKIVDIVKSSGADPIVLQIDELPK